MQKPISPPMQYPDNVMFDWQAKRSVDPSLWQLEHFLNDEWFARIKSDYRETESLWTSRYPNRLVMENNHWLNAILLGAALTPYLEQLVGEPLSMATARGYLDLSGACFYPHFDSEEWVVNVQIYLTDIDRDELGTQFVLDRQINSTIKPEMEGDEIMALVADEWYYTIPFRKNWGYINYNRDRKLHKTRPVPPAFARESLHINYRSRQGTETGLSGVAEWAITGENRALESWHRAMRQLNSVDGLRNWLVFHTDFNEE